MYSEKPSATALLIAKSQLLLADDPVLAAEIGAKRVEYYRSFTEAATGKPWCLDAPSRFRLKLIERLSIPGIYLHYAWRKRRIEQITKEFLANSRAAQVVVIAAGLDPLPAMMSREYADAAFFELDHPATQRSKKAALEKLNHGNNPALIPVDLAKRSVSEALGGSDFSPGMPTLFVAEGITMYLDEDDVTRLFRELRSCTRHEGSRFLFTYMNKQPSGSIQFENATRLADYWLRLKNESFKWGIATGDLAGFLAGTSWRLMSVFDASENASPAKGENICLAAMDNQGRE